MKVWNLLLVFLAKLQKSILGFSIVYYLSGNPSLPFYVHVSLLREPERNWASTFNLLLLKAFFFEILMLNLVRQGCCINILNRVTAAVSCCPLLFFPGPV